MANAFYLTADVDRCVKFYSDILGLPVKRREDNWVEFDLGAGATLAFLKGKGALWASSRGGAEVTLLVDEMGPTLKALRERGVSTLGVLQERPTGWVVPLDDLDGNRLYLMEKRA